MFWREKVCTVGAGTRDVFVKSSHFESEASAEAPDGFNACFPMGAKIALDEVILETGGGATNAAVTMSRFGLKAFCVCRVGTDENGGAVVAALKKNKVSTKLVQRDPDKKTAYSVILLSGSGHRSILVYRGASHDVEIDQKALKKISPSWFYLTSLGGNAKANREFFAAANDLGAKIAWNPGNGELAMGLNKLTKWIKQTDILILNKEEAAQLAHTPPRMIKETIKKLKDLPRGVLVVTDGPHGAYVHERATATCYFAPALAGKRINTTGAGDAFGSACTAAYIKGKDIKECLAAGLCNSTGVITHMGAKAGILPRYPSANELKKAKIKIFEL